ncbi:transcriptional coactivator kelp [Stylonychia lemnae]|uniref:Transcriptional coactivator kelp n=1 Tax=Stylonychia lemnae TaxID=5949 RepID=A0A077ZT92_STYLE|nr:transcriptional coactivator kelp [Stylonychia lemnae]|eukprot:CDW71681.1 transcriptional coactivator kelp [Stylonychia lemnae]
MNDKHSKNNYPNYNERIYAQPQQPNKRDQKLSSKQSQNLSKNQRQYQIEQEGDSQQSQCQCNKNQKQGSQNSGKNLIQSDQVQIEKDKDGYSMFSLSNRKKVVIKTYRKQILVDFRETFEKNGELLYTQKGVSLSLEMWDKLKQIMPLIDKEIQKIK